MIKGIKSYLIKILLLIRGAKIGKNFECYEIPNVESNNFLISLYIGDNVFVRNNVELYFRSGGQIQIDNKVRVDSGSRLLVSNNSTLKIMSETKIGKNTIINAGGNITIGKKCLISANCILQSSSHNYNENSNIQDLGHSHADIYIEDDNWIGANSIVLKGVTMKKGSILSALSKLQENTEPYYIYAGNPAKKIKRRFDEY
jgi:acetyltransferase-like isoleucine patch superfamily enzyme